MSTTEQHLKRITEKLQVLVKNHAQLQKENEKLASENISLKEKIIIGVTHSEELEGRMAALKMASGQLSEIDKKELEKRMNGYIREIDRCISMLAD